MDWGLLVGRTVKDIIGATQGSDHVVFDFDDGSRLDLFHQQDCCESVYLADITGDLNDLRFTPLLMAEESTSGARPADAAVPEYEPESQTWTFYKFATAKGYVTFRWCGESNGYYSETVAVRFSMTS